jgi:hypothetical protein
MVVVVVEEEKAMLESLPDLTSPPRHPNTKKIVY